MTILAIDIGGSHIKFRTQRRKIPVKVVSGPTMTPQKMMKAVKENTEGWEYDRVTIGYPGPVLNNKPLREPFNLAKGWKRFPFGEAFDGKPVRVMNDAAMQALGSYRGRTMLFLGLGTGLGSALIINGAIQAMEIAHLPWKKGKTYEDFLGARRLERRGRREWSERVMEAIEDLRAALVCDYVVLGGGNAKLLKRLPRGVLLGSNENAFQGGFLIWNKEYSNLH